MKKLAKLCRPDMEKQRNIWRIMFFAEMIAALIALGILIKPEAPYRLHGTYSNPAQAEVDLGTYLKSGYEIAFQEAYGETDYFWLQRTGGAAGRLAEGTFQKQEDGIIVMTGKDNQILYAMQLDANRVIVMSPQLGTMIFTRMSNSAVSYEPISFG